MERSNSTSSASPRPNSSSGTVNGPFAYQTRLLERTSSVRSNGSMSRTNSLSGNSILSNPTGGSSTSGTTRRWTPSHKVGQSLDLVRGKWEERSKEGGADTPYNPPSFDRNRPTSPSSSKEPAIRSAHPSTTTFRPPEEQRTPTYLKRRTLPTPIVASPLSPNTTGVTVESESPWGSQNRIHLPTANSSYSRSHATSMTSLDDLSTTRRSHSPSKTIPSWLSSEGGNDFPSSPTSPSSSRSVRNRWLKGDPASATLTSPVSPSTTDFTSGATPSAKKPDDAVLPLAEPPLTTSSVMSPPVYKSAFMNKRASAYGDSLGTGRKLGNHLPRIASGDGDDLWQEPEPVENQRTTRTTRREQRLRAARDLSPIKSPDADDVAGIPGRVRLSRNKVPSAPSTPLPSSRFSTGLWADVQRHHLQAYEYLCHVGEAQQWLEGCLEEELGFGVVEMDEGLRNGVVLAKLVRIFQGDNAVKKIYDAPKLDFRHSDNINHFFNFVRDVGLPDCFIFELTDLYNRKNIPKVIYCIHALSHLLARRGRAARMGNLVGRLKFSDEQLQATQKGLKDSGVAMPNFGNVGRELAKEINEEPDPETEEERRDRLLMECEPSIVALQAQARGHLAKATMAILRGRMRLTDRHVTKLQAHCTGVLTRRALTAQKSSHERILPWVRMLQAEARSLLVQRNFKSYVQRIRRTTPYFVQIQAQARGILQRRRFMKLKGSLRSSAFTIVKLQSAGRARLARKYHQAVVKTLMRTTIFSSVVAFQARCRGALVRRSQKRLIHYLHKSSPAFIAMQGHCRGALLRRRMRTQMAKLGDVSDTVLGIQSCARTYLARKRLLLLIRGLRRATPFVVGFQSLARSTLARQEHRNVTKALTDVQSIRSIGGLQALARASLARKKHSELTQKLEFSAPDVVGAQAAIRGAQVRREYHAWRDHLRYSHPVATLLQALLRGALQRRNFRYKLDYFRKNLNTFVKIQSLFRAKETREQYRQLTMGTNVSVGTIKNFVHLLDDSEADFQEEVKVERLRKKVVESIRENQLLENEISDLEVKIGLVVQNVKSFDELMKTRRKNDSVASHAARSSVLAAHGDPFSGPNTLDHSARRKLELYQQLFYLLQSHGEYLSRLLLRLSGNDVSEKNKRFTERVVLNLFGYGQDRREDYLLLKLFQMAIHDEINTATSIQDILESHPMYINIALQYLRPKQTMYARDTFTDIVREVIDAADLDLESDPSQIYKAKVEMHEIKTGAPSGKEKVLSFRAALEDPETRVTYIRHLQQLQGLTDAFLRKILESTNKMPYSMRYLARETLLALKSKFPQETPEAYAACIGRMVYYRYINPAIITPEVFEVVPKTIDTAARKNLAQVSRILTQITSGIIFGDDNPSYVPINDFIQKSVAQMSAWFLQVAEVPDAEGHFHAHEFLDATVQPKPIYISPNEIYTVHSLLLQYQESVTGHAEDTLRVILTELDGVPNLDIEELRDARDTAITLDLTNRFANVEDPQAEEKTLWVQAKRGVLAILRVQPAQDLWESLMRPVTDNDEFIWEEILDAETEAEQRSHPRRQPSTAVADAYRLEDIRLLNFRAVKTNAIANLLKLEEQGMISRNDGFQGILNAIASDVRSKHRKRVQRKDEMDRMNEALKDLAQLKKQFEEQIESYHDYVKAAMDTMQRGGKGKKRFVIPFTRQYFHVRGLQKSGQTPQFGSFIYTAKHLYDKGILLSIEQYSPRQFDKIEFTMSSNSPGVFTLSLDSSILGASARIATEDINMEDLLQAKYEQKSSLALFGGRVKVNFELFLFQINKKFYM